MAFRTRNIKLYRNKAAATLLALCMAVCFHGCSGPTAYNPELSDLGGVYASRFSDLDLELEISGRLSEEGAQDEVIYAQENWGTNSAGIDAAVYSGDQDGTFPDGEDGSASLAEGGADNRLLRWGISRRPDNLPPKADPGAPELLEKYGAVWIGDTRKSIIYLTFDEGYENGYTPMILDTLAKHEVKAIFFITGPYLKEHQDLVRRMVEEGHTVGNHTIHHPNLPSLDDRQVERSWGLTGRSGKSSAGVWNSCAAKGNTAKDAPAGRDLGSAACSGACYDDWYRDRTRSTYA